MNANVMLKVVLAAIAALMALIVAAPCVMTAQTPPCSSTSEKAGEASPCAATWQVTEEGPTPKTYSAKCDGTTKDDVCKNDATNTSKRCTRFNRDCDGSEYVQIGTAWVKTGKCSKKWKEATFSDGTCAVAGS